MATDPIELKKSFEAKASQDKPLIFSTAPSPKSVKKDYQLSTEELKKLAESDDPSAQLILGLRFSFGTDGCSKSSEGAKWLVKTIDSKDTSAGLCAQGFCFEQALKDTMHQNNDIIKNFYNKAIKQGYVPAMFLLGHILYTEGIISHKDQDKLKTAFDLFGNCTKERFTQAYNCLAICYLKGEGVEKNTNEAFKLFQLGATSGDREAKRNLGLCYEKGWGTEIDKSEARKWFEEAEAQGFDVKEDLKRVSTNCSSSCLIM